MDAEEFTQAHIKFLLKHEKITHIVGPEGDQTISPMGLVQRCLSSNIDFAVPLPDGTAAINAPAGVPGSLSIFKIAAREISMDDYPADDRAEAQEGVQSIDELGGALSDPEEALSVQAHDQDISADKATPAAAETAETVDLSELIKAVNDLPAQIPDIRSEIRNLMTRLDAIVGQTEGETPASSAEILEKLETLSAAISSLPVGAAEPTLAPDIGAQFSSLADQIAELKQNLTDDDGSSQRLEAQLREIAARPLPRPDTTGINKSLARFNTAMATALRRLELVTSKFESRQGGASMEDDALSEKLSEFAQRFDEKLNVLNFEAVMSKLEEIAQNTAVPPAPSAKDGDELERGIDTALAAVAAALEKRREQTTSNDKELTASETPDQILREIGEISSLQGMMVKQLAALIDTQGPSTAAAQEEFLLDLRHTIAELIAEQKRSSVAVDQSASINEKYS